MDFTGDKIADQVEKWMARLDAKGVKLEGEGSPYNRTFEAFYDLIKEKDGKIIKGYRPEIVCYCGSLRKALEAFKKAEYEAVMNGEIALLPCCMFVDIQREYGAESDYKTKADELHKRKIDISDRVVVLNVGGYIGESTRNEINYALEIGKRVSYLEPIF